MKKLEEGMVLIYHTSKGVELGFRKNGLQVTREIEPYDEHWLVRNINEKKITLYNLDGRKSKKTWYADIREIRFLIEIAKSMEISNEVA